MSALLSVDLVVLGVGLDLDGLRLWARAMGRTHAVRLAELHRQAAVEDLSAAGLTATDAMSRIVS